MPQERSETQLGPVKVSETSEQTGWVSLGLWWLWCIRRKLCFSLIFRVLVASVQPNLQELLTGPRQSLGNFGANGLGFTWSLVAMVYQAKVVFFSDFSGFGCIRSTQPTGTPFFTP